MFSSSCTAAAAAAVAGAALAFHHQQRHRIAIFSLRASFAPSMAGSYSCCLSIYWLAVFWSLPPLSSLHPRFRASLFLRFALFSLLQFRRPADAPRSRFTFSVNLFFFFLHFYFFQEIFPCPDVFCFFFFARFHTHNLTALRSFACLLLQLIRLSHFTAILLIANLVVAQLCQSECCRQSPAGAAMGHLSFFCYILQLLSIYLPELKQFSLLAFGVLAILLLWLTYKNSGQAIAPLCKYKIYSSIK